jgi:hypothetical protein
MNVKDCICLTTIRNRNLEHRHDIQNIQRWGRLVRCGAALQKYCFRRMWFWWNATSSLSCLYQTSFRSGMVEKAV